MAVIDLDQHRSTHEIRLYARAVEAAGFVRDYHECAARPTGVAALIERWRRRRAIRRELLPEPDSVLADAGLTRAEAEREARKPFWVK